MVYESMIVAILVAVFGGFMNILYERKFAGKGFAIDKKLLLNRLGMAAAAGALVFYGLADAASTSLNLVEIVQSFGFAKVADFFAFALPFVASGYFADDVLDVFWDNLKKKLHVGDLV